MDDDIEIRKKIFDMLSIIKVAIIGFIIIIGYINSSNYWEKIQKSNNAKFNLYISAFFLFLISFCYFSWILINYIEKHNQSKIKIIWVIEDIFLLLAITLPMYMDFENEYKYLFLLLITSSTIQHGSRYGIITSLLSGIIILIADLLYAPLVNEINMPFQKDLIMVCIFMFVTYILGYYVDIVNDNDKKKEEKLNKLSCKLEEGDRQRNEMKDILLNNEICYDILKFTKCTYCT